LVAVAERFGALPGAVVPWPAGAGGGLLLLLLFGALAIVALRAGARRVLTAAALTGGIMLVPGRSLTSGWPPVGWVFAACDVGQGDALLLNAGDGAAVAVDAGPDPVRVDRCLRGLGIDRIPLLALTHLHLDHVGGLPGLVRGRSVSRVVTGPLDEPAGGWAIVHRTFDVRHRPVETPVAGTSFEAGHLRLTVLGPPFAFHGTRSDPNNSSLILRAEVGGVRVLLPGDEEIEAQRDLVAAGADLRADVLKVPHHGSAYSDPSFLAAVHARVGVISVGTENDYGHPSPLLLRQMSRLAVPVLRTDRDGDIAIAGSPGHLRAVVHGARNSVAAAAGRRAHQSTAERLGPLPNTGSATSAVGARMSACPHDRSPRTICRIRFPASCSSSAKRNCSSSGPSARSPPLRAGWIRRSPRVH
jgi:competence protein ComEC